MTKTKHICTLGLFQPLSIPFDAWSSIGVDFITCLPKSEGKEVIMVVVDQLTKYSILFHYLIHIQLSLWFKLSLTIFIKCMFTNFHCF
jgi:hypothetical protein